MTFLDILEIKPEMNHQPPDETPVTKPHSGPITPKLEMKDSPISKPRQTGHLSTKLTSVAPSLKLPNLDALIAIAKKITATSSGQRCSDTGGPST
jgi:hypothetical protein